MKVYFVTYGSQKFKSSVKKVCREAKAIGYFDKVLSFSEADLPLCIKSSPLFLSGKGGGYWLWKPFIIAKVLNQLEEGDLLIYSDAGNQIFNSEKWSEYIQLAKKHDSIFFQYKENFNYNWNKFDSRFNDSPKLKFWTKKSAVNHFDHLFDNDKEWLEKSKMVAGLIFINKNKESEIFVNEWLNNMLFFPHIVSDLFETDVKNQVDGFALHRHDQSILSILVRYFKKTNNILILDEDFESENSGQIIRTVRRVHVYFFERVQNFIKYRVILNFREKLSRNTQD